MNKLLFLTVALLTACSDGQSVDYGNNEQAQAHQPQEQDDGFGVAEFAAGAVVGSLLSNNGNSNRRTDTVNTSNTQRIDNPPKQKAKPVQQTKKPSLTKSKSATTKKQVKTKRLNRASAKRSSSRRR